MLQKLPQKKPLVRSFIPSISHNTQLGPTKKDRVVPVSPDPRDGRELGARRLLRCSVLKLRLLGFGFVAASDQVTRLDGVHACEHHMR